MVSIICITSKSHIVLPFNNFNNIAVFLCFRVTFHKLKVKRYPIDIARYKMMRHGREFTLEIVMMKMKRTKHPRPR